MTCSARASSSALRSIYGWCEGVLVEKNTNRARKIGGELINFIGKFDMDEDDPSPSAEYGSWLLLERETEPPQLTLEQ